jgi:hypothetical protein
MEERAINWELIVETARALGVNEKNIEKWRQRKSVPHKWRLPIIKEAGLSIDAFEDFRLEDVL